MAAEINAYGARAELRRPLGVVALTIVTLGIYGAVWYYLVNAELRDYGRAYRDAPLSASQPTASLLAWIPGLILWIPPIVSLIGFVGRARRAQRYGRSELVSGWLVAVFVLSFVFIPAIPGYVQSSLNELWRRYPATIETSSTTASPEHDVTDADLAALPPPHPAGASG